MYRSLATIRYTIIIELADEGGKTHPFPPKMRVTIDDHNTNIYISWHFNNWNQDRINDVKAEGKGRSVQRPRKRLKFENVLTVVSLLARTHIALLTNYSDKVAKIVVRQEK